MADRITGAINFSNNFEVQYQGPLDARLATPEYAQLTDGSIPFPYLGMLVAVTSDATVDNNGVYMLTSANSTLLSSWTKIGSDPIAGGNPVSAVAYTKADGNLKVTLTHDGNGDTFDPIEYNVTIDTYESAIADTATSVPTAVGGIDTSNTVADLNGLTQNQMWDKLLFPTVYPSGSGANTYINDIPNYTLKIVGETVSFTLESTASQGTLSNPAGPWAGPVNAALIEDISAAGATTGPFNPVVTPPTGIADVPMNGYEVTLGMNRWKLTTSFDQGVMPQDSTGADYSNARFNAQNKTNTTDFEGVYPIFLGNVGGGFDQAPLVSHSFGVSVTSNVIQCDQLYAENGSTSLYHRISIPNEMINGRNIQVWQLNPVSGNYDEATSGWTQTADANRTIQGNSIQYTLLESSTQVTLGNNYRIKFI